MLKNTANSYGAVAKSFHWGMALLFIAMYIVGFIMINLDKTVSFRIPMFNLHKATGLLLFTLVALRLFWRLINPQPALPASTPRWQRFAAHANIVLLYALMFAMPISGFLTSTLGGHDVTFYGLFTISPFANNEVLSEFFEEAHEYLAYGLIAIFSLHVLASLHHHFLLKDDVLKKMLPMSGK